MDNTQNIISYKLDVTDANVYVYPFGEYGYWGWSFSWPSGSSSVGDSDWHPKLRGAKEEAVARYRCKTGRSRIFKNHKPLLKRARWIKQQN